MNHFIYPKTDGKKSNAKFGNVSCPYLIKLMLELGSRKEDLVAHVVGGARNPVIKSNIGKKNIEMAVKILHKHNIRMAINDVGGQAGRKLVFHTDTGEISINKGERVRESDWYK
jgi:chemotaxis protein CheD